MKVLITGIAGFIGSHLAERLLARGDEVVGLDNFDPFYERETKEENIAGFRADARIVEGDLLDADLVGKVLDEGKFEVIVHLAALAGVRPSIKSPARYQKVNVEGTAVLADLAIQHGVRSFVFASSSSVYGDSTAVPFRETDRADAPVSPYGASKRSGELLLRSLHLVHRLPVTSLRFFTVYGPRQRPEMAIHAFTRAIDRGEPVTLFGAGTSRDYTYVDDIIRGIVGSIDRKPGGFEIYNLGNSHAVELPRLVSIIGKALGKEPRTVHGPQQPGDVQQTFASLDAAKKDLGYEAEVTIEEGVKRFVDWYRSSPRASD